MNAVAMNPSVVTLQELESSLEKALKDIFSTMLQCESEIIPCDRVEVMPPGVSAVVGFGGKISGFIATHMSPKAACTLAEYLVGMNFPEVDDIVADAIGEIVNMLAGGLKKNISENEDMFKISVPSIVCGTDYSTHSPKNAENVRIGVNAGSCSFIIQLCFAMK